MTKSKRPPLTAERQEWVTKNTKLAKWRAEKWIRLVRGYTKDDEFKDSVHDATIIGLVIAASKYKEEYAAKIKFSSYAVHWMDACVKRFLEDSHPLGGKAGRDRFVCVIEHIDQADLDKGDSRHELKDAKAEPFVELAEIRDYAAYILSQTVDKRACVMMQRLYIDGLSERAVGAEFGVSYERVRQIVGRELERLRRRLVWLQIEESKRGGR